jgi:type I restriction enzyme S subunit
VIDEWRNAGWPVVRIRDIGRLHGGGTPSRKRPEYFQGTIPWITGQDISDTHVAEISSARDYVTEEAVKESATRVAPAGSVLVTTRVSVGKTAVAGCPICFSQDVTAIIIHSAAIALPTYVAFFLRSRRSSLLQKNQGSTIAGITRDSLALEHIPLPPLSEQQRIVEVLQEAEAIRGLRAEAEAKIVDLIPAMFADIFGDLYSGKSAFPTQPLSTIGQLDRGKSKHRPRDDASLYGGPYPFLQTGDVANANGWITSFSQTYSEKGLTQSRLWPVGTLLITIAANIGATAVLTFDACFPDSIVGFTPNEEISAEYVRWWLLGYQRKLEIQAPQGAQKNINLEVLRAIRIPVPPLELQLKFKEAIQNLRAQQNATDVGTNIFSMLTSSLAAHAFSGQITADWRETRAQALTTEAHERDAALKEAGATLTRSRRAAVQDDEGIDEQLSDGIHADLNREQRGLLFHILENVGGLRHLRYFTADSLGRSLKGPLRRNPQAIEGHLAVFAVRGLVIPVSREEQTQDTGEFVFGNAYRLALRDLTDLLTDEASNALTTESGETLDADGLISDHARGRELERLVAQIEKERGLS